MIVIAATPFMAFQNEFLRACDLIESFKVMASVAEVDTNVSAMQMKEAIERDGGYAVFIGAADIYLMPGVSAITDGRKWAMLKEILEKLGYKVETDSHMVVKKVTHV